MMSLVVSTQSRRVLITVYILPCLPMNVNTKNVKYVIKNWGVNVRKFCYNRQIEIENEVDIYAN